MRASRAAILAGLGFVAVALLGAALNYGHGALIVARSLPFDTWGHPMKYAGYGSAWLLGAAVIGTWLLLITSQAVHRWRESLGIMARLSVSAGVIGAVLHLLRTIVAVAELRNITAAAVMSELLAASVWLFVPAAIVLGTMIVVTVLRRHALQEVRFTGSAASPPNSRVPI